MHFANDIINVKNRFDSSSIFCADFFFQKLYDCKQAEKYQTRFFHFNSQKFQRQ